MTDNNADEPAQPGNFAKVNTTPYLMAVFVLVGLVSGAAVMSLFHQCPTEQVLDSQPPFRQAPTVFGPAPEAQILTLVKPRLVNISAKTEIHNRIFPNQILETSGTGFLVDVPRENSEAWILTSTEAVGFDAIIDVGKTKAPRVASYQLEVGQANATMGEIKRVLIHQTQPVVLLIIEATSDSPQGIAPTRNPPSIGEIIYLADEPSGLPFRATHGVVTAVNDDHGRFGLAAVIEAGRSGGPILRLAEGLVEAVGITPPSSITAESLYAVPSIFGLLDQSNYEKVSIHEPEEIRRVIDNVRFDIR